MWPDTVWGSQQKKTIIVEQIRWLLSHYLGIIFLISLQHMLWVLIRITSPRRLWCVPTTYVFMENCRKLTFNYHQIPTLSLPLWTKQRHPHSMLCKPCTIFQSDPCYYLSIYCFGKTIYDLFFLYCDQKHNEISTQQPTNPFQQAKINNVLTVVV